MADQLAAGILKRLAPLRSARAEHENIWRECYDLSFPARSTGFSGPPEGMGGVAGKQSRLYNSVSTDSGRILSSGIQSGLTPANSQWFGLTTWQETDAEKRWLSDSATTLWEAIHASNFDADSYECMLDIVAAGWFVLFIDQAMSEQDEVEGFRFEQWPLSSCYCSASKKGGRIDTVYRPYTMTVQQVVAEFGEDGLPERLRDEFNKGMLDTKVELLHAIYPRDSVPKGGRRARNMPYASVHIHCDSQTVLRESGYQEQPFTAPRWTIIPGSVYAVGPMYDALPDIRTLNEFEKIELLNADIAVGGMWIAEDDGVLNPRTIKLGPRKVIVANSVESMKPLQTGSNFEVSFTKRAELVASVRKTLMADQLQPQDGPAMTATEVHVRVQLIRQLLGPVYGRLQAEYLQPLIERCFGIAFRAGLFDEPPESLRGQPFSVVYTSPIAKSQKLEEVSAIEGTVASVGAMARAKQDPTVWDTIDTDAAARLVAEGRGAPASITRSAEDVAALREARAEAQQQAQQAAMQAEVGMQAAQAGINRMAGQ